MVESAGDAASAPLWISEAEVVSLLDLGEAMAALEAGLRQEAAGAAQNMVKTNVAWDGGHTLHAIGAIFPAAGLVGTKTWAHAGGANPLLILFDGHNGQLQAVIEAFALGQMRTGGSSGVATNWLAAPDADEMALIGSGEQAMTQLAAVAAVRRLKRVRVFSPNPEHRAAFARQAAHEFDLAVEPVDTAEAAVAGAPIVTLVTRARGSVVDAAAIARGAHVNAVGAISPERNEFGPDLIARCGKIVVDSVPQVRKLSRELIDAFGGDEAKWARLEPLAKIVAAGAGRPTRMLRCSRRWGSGLPTCRSAWRFSLGHGLARSGIPCPLRSVPNRACARRQRLRVPRWRAAPLLA